MKRLILIPILFSIVVVGLAMPFAQFGRDQEFFAIVRSTTTNTVDTFEDYATDSQGSGQNGGYNWNGPYVDWLFMTSLALNYLDNFETFADWSNMVTNPIGGTNFFFYQLTNDAVWKGESTNDWTNLYSVKIYTSYYLSNFLDNVETLSDGTWMTNNTTYSGTNYTTDNITNNYFQVKSETAWTNYYAVKQL